MDTRGDVSQGVPQESAARQTCREWELRAELGRDAWLRVPPRGQGNAVEEAKKTVARAAAARLTTISIIVDTAETTVEVDRKQSPQHRQKHGKYMAREVVSGAYQRQPVNGDDTIDPEADGHEAPQHDRAFDCKGFLQAHDDEGVGDGGTQVPLERTSISQGARQKAGRSHSPHVVADQKHDQSYSVRVRVLLDGSYLFVSYFFRAPGSATRTVQ